MTVHFKAKIKDHGLEHGAAESFQFPGKELHIRNILDNRDTSTVWIADVRGAEAEDLVRAALLAKVAHQRQAPFALMLPYLPAARSDRGEPPGAEVYADLIKSMNPQQVIGIDPHSSFIVDYFDRIMPGKLTVLEPFLLMSRALRDAGHDTQYDAIICPDKGAIRRATLAAEMLNIDCYVADKHREESTGKILSIEMTEKLPVTGRYLVVDDICDGGATFNRLAEVTELPKDRLGLWVTHGIFSGKAAALRQHYDNIYTTDSHPGCDAVGVAPLIVPCETYMLQNMKEFG